jgi:hypothetical protein
LGRWGSLYLLVYRPTLRRSNPLHKVTKQVTTSFHLLLLASTFESWGEEATRN